MQKPFEVVKSGAASGVVLETEVYRQIAGGEKAKVAYYLQEGKTVAVNNGHVEIMERAEQEEQENKHAQLAKDLGFKHLAESITKEKKCSTDSQTAAVIFPKISEADMKVWAGFLPKSYSKNRGDWSNYSFDAIPQTALEEIQFASTLGFFEDILIRTPEKVQRDPIAIGVIGDEFFMIARWGESLISFDRIKALARRRQIGETTSAVSVSACLLLPALVSVIGVIYRTGIYAAAGINNINWGGVFLSPFALTITPLWFISASCGLCIIKLADGWSTRLDEDLVGGCYVLTAILAIVAWFLSGFCAWGVVSLIKCFI